MFDSRRDVEHLVCRYRYRSARQIEPPCSLEDEDHLFVVMTVRMRNRTFFDFDPGHGNVFANRNLSLIEITDLFPSHRIPIVESHGLFILSFTHRGTETQRGNSGDETEKSGTTRIPLLASLWFS